MSEMPELLPCPFCGEDAELREVADGFTVAKHTCYFGNIYSRLDQWNTRADLCNDKKQGKTVEILKGVRDALEFYGEMIWLPSWKFSPSKGVEFIEGETYISDQIHKDKGNRAREQLTALNTLIEGK